ncbi:MAG TPA: DUF4173 domain-containing protein [Micromonosporaceae bacterium]
MRAPLPPKPRRWPGPERPAAPVAATAVLAAAALGAFAIPLDRSGLGWLVAAVAAVAAVAVAGRPVATASTQADVTAPASDPVGWYLWAAATVALLGVGTVRAAGWLFLLCLLTSLLTGALAVLRGRSVLALGFGIGTSPVAAVRGLAWLSRGAAAFRRVRGTVPRARVAAPIGIAFALLLVFGALFASADAAFARLLSEVVPDLTFWTVFRWLMLLPVIAAMLAAAAFLKAAPPRTADLDEPRYQPVRRLEWVIPLTALDLLFGAFVLVQSAVLFGGERHVLTTAGLTYAQYARSGFWQLLVVTGLTLLVLAGAVRWAPRADEGDRTVVRVLLGVLAGLTLVIVASALYRMVVYADAYGLTRLRVLVFACELWLGTIFVMVLVAGIRLRAPWLPRAVVAAGVFALLSLAAVDPDRTIAAWNLDHGKVDVVYLRDLSADAVPALDRAPASLRACLLSHNAEGLARRPDDWRGFNLARDRARAILAARPVAYGVTSCYRPSGPRPR